MNDNAPTFWKHEQVVHVSEATPVNPNPSSSAPANFFDLEGATDRDAGVNGNVTYQLVGNETVNANANTLSSAGGAGANNSPSVTRQARLAGMPFVLSSTGHRLGLVVTHPLDRERVPSYQLFLIATDRGTPPKSSTATLLISVEGMLLRCLLYRIVRQRLS